MCRKRRLGKLHFLGIFPPDFRQMYFPDSLGLGCTGQKHGWMNSDFLQKVTKSTKGLRVRLGFAKVLPWQQSFE
jgi:hypothetical protein